MSDRRDERGKNEIILDRRYDGRSSIANTWRTRSSPSSLQRSASFSIEDVGSRTVGCVGLLAAVRAVNQRRHGCTSTERERERERERRGDKRHKQPRQQ